MEVPLLNKIQFGSLEKGKIFRFWYNIISDTFGNPIQIPILVARGRMEGKILGLTAAVHGNELNGIPVIHRLFKELDPNELAGTVVGIPAVNVPSMIRSKRRFNDGKDLNHIFPGIQNGNASEVYAYRFFNALVRQFDYLIDLHTASFGRINSYYIRADMSQSVTARMALLQNSQIIVHNPPSDGTLRGAADEIGIPAITLEVGNPQTFQKGMIRSGLTGIYNVLSDFQMISDEIEQPTEPVIVCRDSYWIYTDRGGILKVHKNLVDTVKAGEHIATQENIFGDLVCKYEAPEAGVVVGKSTNPINQTGGRILHLGLIDEQGIYKHQI
jgi:hypothetical protein